MTDREWKHANGDTDGQCDSCAAEDESLWGGEAGSDPHEAELDPSSEPDGPWCAICGHDIAPVEP